MNATLTSTRARSFLAEQTVLASEYLAGRRSWRTDLAPARNLEPRRSFDRAGLEALVRGACAEFRQKAGFGLPYNLPVHGSWVGYPAAHAIREDAIPKGYRDDGTPYWGASTCKPGTVEAMVGEAAKTAAFIRAAADSPFLRRVLKAGTSPNGVNSPATEVDVYALAGRYSPKAAVRQGIKIRRRANEILAPMGLRVSWKGVSIALTSGPKGRIGKSAIIAAAVTLGYDANPGYARARAYLMTVCRTVASRPDNTDGVLAHITGETVTRHGISVTPITRGFPRRQAGFVVTGPGGRTYHAEGGWTYPHDAAREVEWAILDARRAWNRQRKVEREARARDARLASVSVLVTWADSYNAGNCRPGTLEFAKRHGWQNRTYVPAAWLRATHDHAAQRAANYAEREVLRLMAA